MTSVLESPPRGQSVAERPAKMAVLADQIPDELKAHSRWVNWKWTWNDKASKWDKPPLRLNGKAASTKRPESWTTVDHALLGAGQKFDGIGFVFGAEIGIVGIDLDNCRNPATGEIHEPAASIIRHMDTYAEVSPSGTGVKLFVKGKLPKKCRKVNHEAGIEVYAEGRYFTVTGHRLPESPGTINERQNLIEWLLSAFVDPQHKGKQCDVIAYGDDIEIARSALRALRSERADGYFDWLTVGMALKSVSDELLSDWDAWSRQSPKYAEDVCVQKWRSFNGHGVGIGTLLYWARQDGWKPPREASRKKNGRTCQANPTAEGQRLVRDENRTEIANAKLFVEQHGENVKWCDPWGKWLCWDKQRWRIDDCCHIQRLAKQTARQLWREGDKASESCDGGAQRAIMGFLKSSSSARGIANFLILARSEPGIPTGPEMFDRDPWLFNAANGTIDLRTGKLRPHNRGDYLTKVASVAFDEAAQCPTWERFLDDVFKGNGELIRFVQRSAGYSLTGLTRERCLFFLYGKGKNGKTTLISTLQKCWGDYATQITIDMLMTSKGERHPTENCDFAGRRLAVAAETEDGRRFAESFVKQITGGEDVMKGRRMREDFWQFHATHKLWISGNHKPVIRGTDDAIWDRLRLVPFMVRFDNPDQTMAVRLSAELPGILSWCVQGCLDWQAYGLDEPADVRNATNAYRAESDLVRQFIADCCVVGTGCRAGATELYKAFLDWGGKMEQQAFGVALGEREFTRGRFTSGPLKGRNCWDGIGLLDTTGASE